MNLMVFWVSGLTIPSGFSWLYAPRWFTVVYRLMSGSYNIVILRLFVVG